MDTALAFPETEERLIRDESEIDELCHGIDRIDAEILAAILHRTELSRRVDAAERANGSLPGGYRRELRTADRFGVLGREGNMISGLLFRLAHSAAPR